MRKRMISLILAVLMTALCFACGTKKAEPAAETAAQEPATDTAVQEETPETTAEPLKEPEPVSAVKEPVEEFMLEPEEGCNQLTIYWKKDQIDFDTGDMWIWFEGKDGRGYPLYPCAYGAKCVLNVPEDVKNVGFIVRLNCTEPCGTSWGSAEKDGDADRFAEMTGKNVEIYLEYGDPSIYFSEDGGMTLYQKKVFSFAGITNTNQIKYNIEPATNLSDLSMVHVKKGDKEVAIESLSSLNNTVVTGVITLKEDIDITQEYTVSIEGFGEKVAIPTNIFDSADFIANYTYDGDDLGAVIDGDETVFKVWAPTASEVILNLFEAGNDCDAYASIPMERADKGVWTARQQCGNGTYYTYTVTTAVGTQEAVDPYAKAVGVNGNRGMVINLDATDPAGFREETFEKNMSSYRDAVIWEVHVRDFSNKIEGSRYPGKYLAFTETGLTNSSTIPVGVDYLKQLGVTHIHFQPIYDFATIDETTCEGFNWGYDPKNYNAPEGSYSTDPYHGEVRVNELKQMVQALHANGFAVVMDVVYNHTYDGNSSLNRIVPYYYYRYTSSGENSNGSGCGNETASERYMFRKYMVDSVTYWQTEYRLDGFRFDLMGLHDTDTMQAIEQAVHAIDPQAIIYGEGWTGGTSTLRANRQAVQANIREVKASEGAAGAVAVFNDAIRDGLKGSVFDAKAKGYISGDPSALNANKVLFGVTGGEHTTGANFKVDNALLINYMSSHDNRTLWDILKNANPDADEETLYRQNQLGAAIVLLSRGTPFMLAGEEMLRTKNGDENSYKSSDEINNIDWERLTMHSAAWEMSKYYSYLIELRKENDWIRNGEVAGEIGNENSLIITYTMDGTVKGVAFANPTDHELTFLLPEGTWTGLLGGAEDATGEIAVPAGTLYLFKAAE